jgi:hypothetical protein
MEISSQYSDPHQQSQTPHIRGRFARWFSSERRKKMLLVGIVVIEIFVCIEIVSWLLLTVMERQWMTYGKISILLAGVQEAPTNPSRANPAVKFDGLRVVHPYLGFATPPTVHKDSTRNQGEEWMEQYGFDVGSGPLAREKKNDTVVIGIFGGSVAKQFWERGGAQVMIEELKKDPALADKNIVFSSAAFYSYRQPQEMLALSYLLTLGAKFDIVLEIDGFNEMCRWGVETMNGGVFPFYPLVWEEYMRIMDADPVLRLKIGDIALRMEHRDTWAGLMRSSPLHWSMTANFLWLAFDHQMETSIVKRQNALTDYRSSIADSFAVTGPVPHYDSQEAFENDLASVWEEGARQMHSLAAANGIRYFHFLQPNGYLPDSKPLTEQERFLLNVPLYRGAVELGFPLLKQAKERLESQGINFTDLTEIFRDVQEDVYMDDCCHMNPVGNAIMGKRIAETILQDLAREPLKK